jgi:molecular chaperone GrpE
MRRWRVRAGAARRSSRPGRPENVMHEANVEGAEALAPVSGDAGDSAPAGAATPEATRADAQAYQDRWLRAEAELQNFRRRAGRDLEESRRHAEEAVLLDLIGVLDDLERGIEAARAAGAEEAWLEGIRLVASRMRDVLERRGVEAMDPVGQPFDPEQHEALLEVPAAGGVVPGAVAQVILKGYRRGGRTLRAARVVVARDAAENGA